MQKRAISVGLAVLGLFAVALFGAYAGAGNGKGNVKSKQMSSYQEVPSISTGAKGKFEAKIQGSTIS